VILILGNEDWKWRWYFHIQDWIQIVRLWGPNYFHPILLVCYLIPWFSNPVIRHISLIYVQVSINQSTGLRCCHFCAWEVVVHFVVIYGIADHQCLYRGPNFHSLTYMTKHRHHYLN
jgi:hypothetical protein